MFLAAQIILGLNAAKQSHPVVLSPVSNGTVIYQTNVSSGIC